MWVRSNSVPIPFHIRSTPVRHRLHIGYTPVTHPGAPKSLTGGLGSLVDVASLGQRSWFLRGFVALAYAAEQNPASSRERARL